jgi:predicted enzyme related to lactoylglutathione lyase
LRNNPRLTAYAAEAFYATVFNWTFKDVPRREDQPDHTKTRLFDFNPGGVSLSGGLQHRPEDEGTGTPAAGPGGVCLYWLVEDLNKIAEVIGKAGGKMVGSKEAIKEGEHGLYRYFEDTEGNVGAVYQMV